MVDDLHMFLKVGGPTDSITRVMDKVARDYGYGVLKINSVEEIRGIC